jgi:hypothetical protein
VITARIRIRAEQRGQTSRRCPPKAPRKGKGAGRPRTPERLASPSLSPSGDPAGGDLRHVECAFFVRNRIGLLYIVRLHLLIRLLLLFAPRGSQSHHMGLVRPALRAPTVCPCFGKHAGRSAECTGSPWGEYAPCPLRGPSAGAFGC